MTNRMRRVTIKSWGALTVFGNVDETWDALLAGRSIDDHAQVPAIVGGRRAIRLAHAAASSVAAGLQPDAAVVVGTSKGSIEEWLTAPPAHLPSDNAGGGLTPIGLADVAADLRRTLHLGGPALTLSAACASGLHALIRAALLIQSGEARQALVVATEASVHPLFLGSFQRLGVLAKPGHGCRPFDLARAGFYMTEAAAAVVLEAQEPSEKTVNDIYVERFSLAGDAMHLTTGDPNARVLRRLLARVIEGRPVDLIQAHGTGTELNDATELSAIDDAIVPSPSPPVVYSHKAALGHSLGASGLLSLVLNCVCHRLEKIPGNIRTTDPLDARNVVIPREATARPIRRSLAIASGFGGPTAVVGLAVR